jgi:L-amino acid N-acyltransferase YncA
MVYQLMKRSDDGEIPEILSVYRLPSVSRFISIDEGNYWNYATSTDHVFFYKIYQGDALAATAHLELADRVLSMDVVVFSQYQRKGMATRIVKDIQEGKLGPEYDRIRVFIDEKNTASLRLFQKAGFVCVGKEEELWEYVFEKHSCAGIRPV